MRVLEAAYCLLILPFGLFEEPLDFLRHSEEQALHYFVLQLDSSCCLSLHVANTQSVDLMEEDSPTSFEENYCSPTASNALV